MAYKKNYKKQPAKKTLSEAQVKKLIKANSAPKPRPKRNYYQNMGARIGKSLGSGAGYMLGKWLGSGDYTVKANTLIKPSSVPIMHSNDSSVRICHKEFISDITATNLFSSDAYSINPGLSHSFPYLSGIAQNFESYRIHGMVYTFKSTSADALNSTNTALGSMLLATDYNALDSNFTTKAGFLATTFSNSGKPASDILHPIECSAHVSSGPAQRYIRSAAQAPGSDLRLYDWGNFQIASVGQQATSVVGELWCSYDVELINPQLTIPRGLNIVNNISNINVATVNNTNIYGTAGTVLSNTLALNISGNSIRFPAGTTGNYVIVVTWNGATGSGVSFTSPVLVNCSPLLIFNNGTVHSYYTPTNGLPTASACTFICAISIDDPQIAALVTTVTATLPTGLNNVDFNVFKVNGNL